MKKILLGLFIFLGSLGITYGQTCDNDNQCGNGFRCISSMCVLNTVDDYNNDMAALLSEWSSRCPNIDIDYDNISYINQLDDNTCCFDGGGFTPKCPSPTENTSNTNTYGNMGINMNDKCLVNGQCSLNIYQTLGIRKSNPRPDVQTFVQDIILALTNFFGTVVAVILVVSGLLYIFSSFKGNSSLASTAKSGIFGSLIGLLLVSCSYAIIRLIQFIATGGA